MVNGKAPITKCENVAKFQTIADIDKPTRDRDRESRAAATNASRAPIQAGEDRRSSNDNVTIFDEILKGNADVMISESVETLVQQKLRPGLCAVNPDKPLQYGEMAYLLPRGDVAITTDVTIPRSPLCAVLTAEQVPAWIASLPRQRSITDGRRHVLVARARAAVPLSGRR